MSTRDAAGAAARDGGRADARPRALVTGASAGIGAAFARALARRGHDLVLVARRGAVLEDLGRRLAAEHGCDVEILVADLATDAGAGAVAARLAADPPVDVLVNNAGFGTYGALWELDAERELEQVRLLVEAVVRLCRAALPGMLARGRGAIVNVSSTASFRPGPFHATYAASKAFVSSFTEALHEELRGSPVRVQLLAPGATRTEFFERAGLDVSRLPTAAWSMPERVVEASLAALGTGAWLCVPHALNRADLLLRRWLPRALVRRVAGAVGRRALRGRGGSSPDGARDARAARDG